MTSERLSAVVDSLFLAQPPITKLVARIESELELGYYNKDAGKDVLRKVLKWAQKYRDGDD